MRQGFDENPESTLIQTPHILRRSAPVAALAGLALAACAPNDGVQLSHAQKGFAAAGFSDAALQRLAARMSPSARALALRHDPALHQADLWNRPEGWESLDIDEVPTLGAPHAVGETAQEINALLPFTDLPIRPMRPFVLKVGGEDRARALECLTQAVYYEAAREPEKGQEAVAQVVLNRLRHPAYPKSVCGVVYQGSARATGCQFTFTCDGSLRWAPEPALWRRARQVAERALAGHVVKDVGSATHYHASYVAPYWAPTLVKLNKVGQHIFYRWTGPWGEPPAFTGRYAGGEARLTRAVLGGLDARTQGGLLSPDAEEVAPPPRTVTLAVAGEVRTYTVADASAPGGLKTRVAGTLTTPRRQASADDIKAINEKLAAYEKSLETPAAAPTQD